MQPVTHIAPGKLPKNYFGDALPLGGSLIVISIDGVVHHVSVLPPMSVEALRQATVANARKFYAEVVGEDRGHYVALTAHSVVADEGKAVYQVGDPAVLWEDGVRSLTRLTPKEAEASKPKAKAAKTRTKPKATAKKATSKRTVAKRTTRKPTAKKTASRSKAKTTARRTVRKPGRK